jgi:hypothetical protein
MRIGEKDSMEKKKNKAKYKKPQLRVIELKAEEVLSDACKLAFGGSAVGGGTCVSVPCSAAGS